MIMDCPNIKNKNVRTKFKSERVDERAMVASWSGSNSYKNEVKMKKSPTSISWLDKAKEKMTSLKR